MRDCVEEGTLQAYFDGELSSEMMERVATHIAACAHCAAAEREIEADSEMLAGAFAPEMSLSVPTERLRARIDDAIAGLQPQQQNRAVFETHGSRLRTWFAALASPFSFMPQQAMGFASLIAVAALGLVLAFVVLRRSEPTPQHVARSVQTPELKQTQSDSAVSQSVLPAKVTGDSVARPKRADKPASFTNAGLKRQPGKVTPAVVGPAVDLPETQTASVKLLPGEKNYLKAIASLDTAIKSGGDNALRPNLRAEYERNLHVVDEAIAQTRAVAQRNPHDKDAAEFLLSAYQSKVELLNTVAEQAQLSTRYR